MYPHMGNQKLYKVVNSMRLERWVLLHNSLLHTYLLANIIRLTIDVPGCCLSQHYPAVNVVFSSTHVTHNVARYLSTPTYFLLTIRPLLLINCLFVLDRPSWSIVHNNNTPLFRQGQITVMASSRSRLLEKCRLKPADSRCSVSYCM